MKKILIVNPFGVGDVIFSFPLMEAIKQNSPEIKIGFLCNERTEALCRMSPLIDEVFVFNRDHFRDLWAKNKGRCLSEFFKFLAAVRQNKFDVLIDLSLGREYSFYAWLIGIRERVGFNYKGRGLFLTKKVEMSGYDTRAVAETQKGLLKLIGIEDQNHGKRAWFKHLDHTANEASEKKIIAIVPGGGRTWGENAHYKQWDPERFAAIIRQINRAGVYRFVLLGDEKEKGLIDKVTAGLEGIQWQSFIGQDLERVCGVLTSAELVLCNDGGLCHLANALGVKTVCIFGPVDEKVYGPCRTDVPSAVVVEAVACRPCYKKFRFSGCVHNRACLDNLKVDKVLDAVYSMLKT